MINFIVLLNMILFYQKYEQTVKLTVELFECYYYVIHANMCICTIFTTCKELQQ